MVSVAASPETQIHPKDVHRNFSPRLDFIDGLRGFACLYVVVYHLFLLWPVSSHEATSTKSILIDVLTRISAFGNVGVDIFLALSGFCLFYPLCRRAQNYQAVPKIDLGRYAQRRARRIAPPYIAALIIFAILPVWGFWARMVYPAPTVVSLILHALFLHNLTPGTILGIDSPLWSLALEAQLYVLFPLLVFGFRRLGPVRLAALAVAVSFTYRELAWYVLGARSASFGEQFTLMNAVPGRFHEFVLGMCAAFVLTRSFDEETRGKFSIRLSSVLCILIGLVLAYVSDKHWGEYSPLTSLFWGLLAFGLILGAAQSSIFPLRVFGYRPLVQVGLISYSIYLIHEPLLRVTGAYARGFGIAPALALGTIIVVLAPVLLGASLLFYRLFEMPFLTSGPRAVLRPTNPRFASEPPPPLASGGR